MSTPRLAVISILAIAFAAFETWTAYDEPDGPNRVWAGISWLCIVFVAGLWWEARRKQ